MAFAFLESLAFTGLLVLLSAALPLQWLREGFATKAMAIAVVLAAASIAFQYFLTTDFPSPILLAGSCLLPLLLCAALIGFIQFRPRLKNLLASIQDRFSIMLYIYVPLGIVSLAAIVVWYLL